ncbi:hypothetical protein H9P43_003544 [Blastocladiella emersonii ATCC 22665]|nr:hypothetical protein H9P43_003544 [Blastocladiella emersonii ATCC 22665]
MKLAYALLGRRTGLPRWLTVALLLITTLVVFQLLSGMGSSIADAQESTPPPHAPRAASHHPRHRRTVSYLPHSGYHNQRIALENAIVLAHLLDRDLVVPPRIVAHSPLPHRSFPVLLQQLRELPPDQLTSWEAEYDWPKLHRDTGVRVASFQANFTYLEPWLGLKPVPQPLPPRRMPVAQPRPASGVVLVADVQRYEYQITDGPVDGAVLDPQFASLLSAKAMRERDEAVMVFGSMFGSKRLALRDPKNVGLRETVLEFTSRRVVSEANRAAGDSAIQFLGGAGAYIGVHVRAGDGGFDDNLASTVTAIIAQLDALPESGPALDSMCPRPVHASVGQRRQLIYLATDLRHPESASVLGPLFARYPCTWTLDQVRKAAAPASSTTTAAAGTAETGTSSSLNFSPDIVDGLVAGAGTRFIGTAKSTYSAYVQRQVWLRECGRPIVDLAVDACATSAVVV